jgi:hypothetical protein
MVESEFVSYFHTEMKKGTFDDLPPGFIITIYFSGEKLTHFTAPNFEEIHGELIIPFSNHSHSWMWQNPKQTENL